MGIKHVTWGGTTSAGGAATDDSPPITGEILKVLTGLADEAGGVMVASLHAPDLIREHFSRVIGLRQGILQFDIPARELTPSVLEALYDLDRDSQS